LASSPTATEPVPRMETALSFLWPQRAPWPPLPALWNWSVERQAQRTSRSPAGPMDIVLAAGSKSRRIASSILEVVMPQYFSTAGMNETTSSLMVTTTGSGDSPWMMMAS